MKKQLSEASAKLDEWTAISNASCEAEFAAVDAFAALAGFDSKAPSKGGQKAYDKWRDENNDAREVLAQAALHSAREYIEASEAEDEYFAREEHDAMPYICPDCRARAH